MLKDAGASAVIVGHSERRQYHGETDAAVRAKALAARRAGIFAIVCVGETRAERDAGQARAVVARATRWLAAGWRGQYHCRLRAGLGHRLRADADTRATSPTCTAFIRQRLCARYGEAGQGTRILYGGSVKPANAKELMAVDNVDGALVGGASLKADEFLGDRRRVWLRLMDRSPSTWACIRTAAPRGPMSRLDGQ